MKPPVDGTLRLFRVVTLTVCLISLVDSVCVQLDARTYAQRFQIIQEVRPCTRGAGKVNEGCEMVAHCCPGYYFFDQALQQGLHLVCKGGRWSERRTQQTKTHCVPGCHALRPNIITELGNATIVTFTQPQNPWVNGYKAQAVSVREIYWARGTVVVTRCKPGYSFEDAHHRQKGTDSFTCMGGSTYWQDNVSKKTAVSRPGLCKPNCDAIT
ncbi:hypothetical protein AAVH_06519 [Aphelenchoides avenae]|nr:hypothetical protein AAVH_06519 [Aphelenchus avenae]